VAIPTAIMFLFELVGRGIELLNPEWKGMKLK